MCSLARRFVGGSGTVLIKKALAHQAFILEPGERAIDRSQAQLGLVDACASEKGFSIQVPARFFENLEEHQPLPCDPQPFVTQAVPGSVSAWRGR